MRKVTFLIPAHNEEKHIGFALDKLAALKRELPSIEVLVGLDGCTDNTKNVVSGYRFAKIIESKRRLGKAAMMEKLISKASGEIMIVNDADWMFIGNRKDLEKLLSLFDDPKLGGIGDYYAITYTPERVDKVNNALYLGDAWTTRFFVEYKMQQFAERKNSKIYAKPLKPESYLFFVNFFRKSAVGKAKTTYDDGERYIQMADKGYRVQLLPIDSKPYLLSSYTKIDWKGLYKQKVRGAVGRKAVADMYGKCKTNFFNLYIPSFLYVLHNLPRIKRLKAVYGILIWWFISLLAAIKFALMRKPVSTQEAWKLQYKRKV